MTTNDVVPPPASDQRKPTRHLKWLIPLALLTGTASSPEFGAVLAIIAITWLASFGFRPLHAFRRLLFWALLSFVGVTMLLLVWKLVKFAWS